MAQNIIIICLFCINFSYRFNLNIWALGFIKHCITFDGSECLNAKIEKIGMVCAKQVNNRGILLKSPIIFVMAWLERL